MYIILSAILFHDIGKISETETHAKISRYIIAGNLEYSDYNKQKHKTNYGIRATLGIPSHELALSFGRISEYHDVDRLTDQKEIQPLKNSLTSTYIDGYGCECQ